VYGETQVVDPEYPIPPHCPYSGTEPVADGEALEEVEVEVVLDFDVVVLEYDVVELVVVAFDVVVLEVDADVAGVLALIRNATQSWAATVTV